MHGIDTQAFVLILTMGIVTLGTRLLPYLIFGTKDTIPPLVVYLGKIIPYAAMGMLIIYCLKDTDITAGSHGIPEAIAAAAVAVSYIWKKSTILSVLFGTILYMVLVQTIF